MQDFIHNIGKQTEDTEIESDDENDESYTEEDAEEKNNTLLNNFSLEYMQKAVDYYDQVNVKTDKKSHS